MSDKKTDEIMAREAESLTVTQRAKLLRELATEAGEAIMTGAPVTQEIVRLRKLLESRKKP